MERCYTCNHCGLCDKMSNSIELPMPVCADCGHVAQDGESLLICAVCGSHSMNINTPKPAANGKQ